MEFDPAQLNYLNFKLVKKLSSCKTNVTFLFQDLIKSQNLRVITFEKTESEKLIYKFLKDLYHTRLTESLLYRDSVNGFPFLILELQGPDLGRMFEFMDFKFTEVCVMLIGFQVVFLVDEHVG